MNAVTGRSPASSRPTEGTYVNKWALDGFRLSQLRRLGSRLMGASLRYHVEFEKPSSLAEKLKQAGFPIFSVHGAMVAPLRILHKTFSVDCPHSLETYDAVRRMAFR
jgi:hypothetical protein